MRLYILCGNDDYKAKSFLPHLPQNHTSKLCIVPPLFLKEFNGFTLMLVHTLHILCDLLVPTAVHRSYYQRLGTAALNYTQLLPFCSPCTR
mmetsp:Transcript_30627/g.5514  ORF Transcript_30627/g.5514 Transcript_30627/m.5514 type:complete len:91 (-) Transcript_30627:311-583(-)